MARAWLVAAFGTLLIVAAASGLYQQSAATRAELTATRALNDSTVVRLAATTLERDSLAGLVAAAKTLKGDLVAGAKLRVSKRDTVIFHDTLYVDTLPNQHRTAKFRDSTFAGVIEGTIKAPPFPAPLSLTYSVSRPAFSPSVGFVRMGDTYAAVVTWQGERVEVEAPFVRLPPPPKRVVPYVTGAWTPGGATGGAGVEVRLTEKLRAYSELRGTVLDGQFVRPMPWVGGTWRF